MEHAQGQGQDDEGHDPRANDRRAVDRRHLQDVASGPRPVEDRRLEDRRRRDRRVRIAGAGLLAGLSFTLGVRGFANLRGRFEATAPLASDTAPEAATPEAPAATDGQDSAARTWDRASLEPFIQEAAALHGLPADLIRAVIQTESHFNPLAVSRVGAQGLMQLMPRTAAHLGIENPFDPRENILGGTKYLSALLARFDGNTARALAAYNAGPTVVARHRGIPPFRETRGYVQKIHNLVVDTEADFVLPPAPKVRRARLHARSRQASVRPTAAHRSSKVSSRTSARHAASRRPVGHRTATRGAVPSSRRARR